MLGGVATTVKIKTLAHAAKFEMENKICRQDNHPHMQDLHVLARFCLLAGKTLDTLLYLVSQPTVHTPERHPSLGLCSCTFVLLLAKFAGQRKRGEIGNLILFPCFCFAQNSVICTGKNYLQKLGLV